MTTRTPAWQRLAGNPDTKFEGLTITEAMDAAGLSGWNVRTRQLATTADLPDGRTISVDVPKHRAVVRDMPDGTAANLGVVGTSYRPIQNEAAFQFAANVIHASHGHVTGAGSMDDLGRKVFMSIALPQGVKVKWRGIEDDHELSIVTATSHDGSLAHITLPSLVRFTCTNQLSGMGGHAYKVRHSGNASGKVEEARLALQITLDWATDYQETAHHLLTREFTDSEFGRLILKNFAPDPKEPTARKLDTVQTARAQLHHLFTAAETTEFGRGTRYAAFQAISEWSEWVHPKHPDSRTAANSVLVGNAATVRQRAWNLLTAN